MEFKKEVWQNVRYYAVLNRIVYVMVALLLAVPYRAAAHEIPNDLTIQALVKPQRERLHLLVRVPLKALRDVSFPERGPGYLDLAKVSPLLPDAATLWISDSIDLYEGDARLLKPRVVETRISLESGKSFATYQQALAHATGASLRVTTDVYWNQTTLDVLFEYPIQSDQSRFSINPDGLLRLGLRVVTVLRFLPPSGVVRAFECTDAQGC